MSQYTPSYGQPVGGPTWIGSAPRPGPAPLTGSARLDRMSRAGDPMMRKAEAMKLGLISLPQSPSRAGGGGSRGGGGGGPTFGFAPTNYENGNRYNAEGYRADGRRRIEGFSRKAAGLPDYGGLNEFYANQEGTRGDRTNPAFYAGSEDNNQPPTSPQIAGQLDKRNETLVPFAGGIVRTNKPSAGNFDEGGFLRAGQTGNVVQDGRPELAVPLDGSAPVPLTDPMKLKAAKDLVILSNDQLKQLKRSGPAVWEDYLAGAAQGMMKIAKPIGRAIEATGEGMMGHAAMPPSVGGVGTPRFPRAWGQAVKNFGQEVATGAGQAIGELEPRGTGGQAAAFGVAAMPSIALSSPSAVMKAANAAQNLWTGYTEGTPFTTALSQAVIPGNSIARNVAGSALESVLAQQKWAIPMPLRDSGGSVTSGQPYAVARPGEVRLNADGSVPTNKPGAATFDQGGFLRAGETGNVVQDGRPELAVPLDGSAPVPLTDPMAMTAAKDLVILSNDQLKQLPQLRQDGITPLGGGRAVMSNQYGTGMAMPGAGGLPMADERGVIDVEAMKASKGRASMAAFPDGYVLQKDRPGMRYVPDPLAGTPMGTMSGIMPNDPALVRQGIAQFQAANQSATNAVNAVDPAALAAEMQLRNPLLRTWEAGGGTQGRPLPSTMQAPAPRFMPGQAPLAQQVGLSTMPGLPMSAVRGGMTSMNRFLDSRAGRDAVGQQMLQQAMTPPEAPLQPWALPVPGGNEVIYGVGRNVMGTRQAPEPQSDEDLLAEAYRVDTPEELRALMGKTRNMAIIKEARSRLDKMTTSTTPTDEVYWDALNSKMVKIPAGYEPPPELGLKRMARKGEAMPAPGGAGATAAPNQAALDRYFGSR